MGLFFKKGSVHRRGITKKTIGLSLLTRGTTDAAAVCGRQERTAAEEGTSSMEDWEMLGTRNRNDEGVNGGWVFTKVNEWIER